MNKILKFITVSLMFLIALGCTQPFNPNGGLEDILNNTFGVLNLSIGTSGDNLISARSVDPGESANVDYYTIEGTSGENSFGPEVLDGTDSNLSLELKQGDWNIVIEAFNSNDFLVGLGEVNTTINAGGETSVSINISDLTDDGTFLLSIDWSNVLGTINGREVSIEANLGEDILVGNVNENVWSSTSDFAPGNYNLDVIVSFGGTEAWRVDQLAVRVLSNSTSEKIVVLTEDPNNPNSIRGEVFDGTGGFTIIDDTTGDAPFSVELELSGTIVTLNTTEGVVSDNATYTWFINGVEEVTNESFIELTEAGEYSISASVESEGFVRSDYNNYIITTFDLSGLVRDGTDYVLPIGATTIVGTDNFSLAFDEVAAFTISFVRDNETLVYDSVDGFNDVQRRGTSVEELGNNEYLVSVAGNVDEVIIDTNVQGILTPQ